MDVVRFDALTRTLGAGASRRGVLGGALAALALGVLPPAGEAGRKKNGKRKRRKERRKAEPNAFGCLNAGRPCNGNDGRCCSGICDGRKPKRGKRDRSRCVGHDESTCLPGQRSVFCGGGEGAECATSAGGVGQCDTTTGNAAYCAADGECFPCKRDADCRGVCGPQAACIPCPTCSGTGGTVCASGGDPCTF